MRYIFCFLIFLVACNPPEGQNDRPQHEKLAPGPWRFAMNLNDVELPFEATINLTGYGRFSVEIHNSEERILAEDGRIEGDSIFFTMPLFDSEFRGQLESPHLITGHWHNFSREDYRIPFVAEQGKEFRFSPTPDDTQISHRYKVRIQPPNREAYDVVLVLDSDSAHRWSGTFMTETGDYRFLEGSIIQNKLYLSTFNGSAAYYFSAGIEGDQLVDGVFLSGTHYKATWEGVADTTFRLADPTRLTGLKEGMESIDFHLPNEAGEWMTWDDLDLDGKVVVVEITGSWCPNCLDANRSTKEILSHFTEDEVAFLPINFELSDSLPEALPSIRRMQKVVGDDTPFLFGGKATRENVESALPMLDGFRSYPTLIFVDKSGNVVRIYTGFYGPGTGEPHQNFMRNTKELLERLVAEEPAEGGT